MRKSVVFALSKTKTQIRCAVTAQLIRAFVFTKWIVQSLYFLKTSIRKAINRDWSNRKANPALKTKTGNK